MKIAMLHAARDLRIEDWNFDGSQLEDDQIWVETQVTGFKIGTDRGNYEGAEQVPGAPDFPRGVGDSNLGIVKKIGTPTMGGVLILLGLFSGVLLWGDLSSRYIWFLLFIYQS